METQDGGSLCCRNEVPNIEFHENPSNGSGADTCGQKYERT